MKHTPGPWFVKRRLGCKGIGPKRKGHQRGIDEVCDTVGLNEKEDAANARLIAAAPDLLAACKSALALLREQVELVCGVDFEPPPNLNAENDEIMRLQAAIAKATGEEA